MWQNRHLAGAGPETDATSEGVTVFLLNVSCSTPIPTTPSESTPLTKYRKRSVRVCVQRRSIGRPVLAPYHLLRRTYSSIENELLTHPGCLKLDRGTLYHLYVIVYTLSLTLDVVPNLRSTLYRINYYLV